MCVLFVKTMFKMPPSCADFAFNQGSTDLEKVTVKSLDEIKREKVRRQKESATTTSCANATQKQDTAPDENPFGKISIAQTPLQTIYSFFV